jgi:O-methyltransferase/methyltransferase family protein
MPEPSQPPPDAESPSSAVVLRRMIDGYRFTQLLYVVAKLGIADLLRDGPKRSEELAQAVGAHPRTLYRVLRALASLGVFVEDEAQGFHLTPLAQLLRTDVPESLRALAIFYGEEWIWHAEGALLYSVRTGKAAFHHVHGMSPFDYYRQHAEAAAGFNAAMTNLSGHELAAIIAAYDFTEMATIVDVGGGQGALLAEILKTCPHMRGILFDLPAVVESAQPFLTAAGIAERCTCVAGDFFQRLPGGGDAYILKRVIHDWDDAQAAAMLTQCRQAMPAHGRLLLMERVIPPGNTPSVGKLADITMLVHYGALERTEAEFRGLLEAAGFTLVRIIPTQTSLSIIEGVHT